MFSCSYASGGWPLHRLYFLWQVDSLRLLSVDLEKQLDSLKAAAKPTRGEVDRLKELENIISAEKSEINRLLNGSKELKEKVCFDSLPYLVYVCASLKIMHSCLNFPSVIIICFVFDLLLTF